MEFNKPAEPEPLMPSVNEQYGYPETKDTSWFDMIIGYLKDKRSAVEPKLAKTV
jgi:hypothetical protein